jgi:3-hydroxybutyrate dehydrogenase
VTSNGISPGYVRTPLVQKQIADQARLHGIAEDDVVATVLLAENAVKRLVEPAEVAELPGLAGWARHRDGHFRVVHHRRRLER